MADVVLHCLNLNSEMHFSVRSRCPVTFNTKLFFVTKSSILDVAWLKLNTVTPAKILKGIGWHLPTHDRVEPWENFRN